MNDSERDVNEAAIERMAFAAEALEESVVCPFCGMQWDNAVLRHYVEALDGSGARAYMDEMRASPLNATGDGWGQRAPDGD